MESCVLLATRTKFVLGYARIRLENPQGRVLVDQPLEAGSGLAKLMGNALRTHVRVAFPPNGTVVVLSRCNKPEFW